MSKRRTAKSLAAAKPQNAGKPEGDAGGHSYVPSPAAIRETIESLAIAFVLAFLFRTFEAEAFVIPTGSMAPTLMGRHKDLVCPMCGYEYRVGASEELDRNEDDKGPAYRIGACTCPMCRYTANLCEDFPRYPPVYVRGPDDGRVPVPTVPSYNGDRILVDKLAYEFSEPKRWDVVVFHYPNDATTNYIKRLVGLPGETVRIQDGDIWTRRNDKPGAIFQIERKRPEKLVAMLQPVFDNDYMPAIAKQGWPERWRAEPPAAGAAGAWQPVEGTGFASDGKAADVQWLRYRHLVPTAAEWAVKAGGARPPQPDPQLITDFMAFDTSRPRGAPLPYDGRHWVGDLAVECTAEVESDAGTLVFELRKGGRQFQCRIDVATGGATLSINGLPQFHPRAQTAVRGKSQHDIRFSNCDNEMLLWVDGSLVAFDARTSYDDLGNTRSTEDDKEPAGIGSTGAAVRISRLRLFRDIYYIALKWTNEYYSMDPEEGHVEFTLANDKFLMLGDNSPNSQDSRLWPGDRGRPRGRDRIPLGNGLYWVDRDLLIGKAMFVYWPHSWNEIRTGWGNIPCPYFPNFSRMRLVR